MLFPLPTPHNCYPVKLFWRKATEGPGASSSPCSDSYHGPSANSEVEVQAIVEFIKNHGKVKAFLTLHSYSQLLMFPYGYKCAKPESFDELGFEYSVTIEDLQALLDDEDEEMQHNEGQERNGSHFNYGAYHSLEAIYHEMDNIASDFPDLVSRVQIGCSFERRPMYVLKFSTGGEQQRPAVWLNAGIHSREWVSQATAIWTARKIVSDYQKDPALGAILEKMDIFLLPVANPDGYVYTQTRNRMWRKTRSLNPGSLCVGTDPNRNWNASFAGQGTSANPCSEVYHGPHANSEVEVKSVVDFIQNHGNFKCFIDLHSYSQLLMYPYGYTITKAPDAEELDEVARRAAKALASLSGTEYQVGPTCTTVYPASGSSIDWAYDNGIKYAFTFELRDTGHYGFLLPANQIIPTAEETWLGLRSIMAHVRDHLY